MDPIHDQDPFWLQDQGPRSLAVDLSQTEVVKHEVLYEDEITRLSDERMFVGRGFPRRRIVFAFAIPIVVLGLLVARAGWMQVVQGAAYRARSDENRFRVEVLPARRGVIRDRNGVILAENVPAFDVRIRSSDLPLDDEGRTSTIASVAQTVGETSDDINAALNATGTSPDEWIDVARDVPYERALALEVKLPQLTGVSLITDAKRTYPLSATTTSLSHVLGYVGQISPEEYDARKDAGYGRTDEIGKTGVERSDETAIRGTPGVRRTEVDAMGRPKAMVEEKMPTDGADVTLTIDAKLQAVAEASLKKELALAKATRGSVIAMDPTDGSILALVSWPAYDNNDFSGTVSSTVYKALLDDPDKPLFTRAVSGQFPSGSTIKPLISTAALAEGVITPHTTVNSVGGIHVGPGSFLTGKRRSRHHGCPSRARVVGQLIFLLRRRRVRYVSRTRCRKINAVDAHVRPCYEDRDRPPRGDDGLRSVRRLEKADQRRTVVHRRHVQPLDRPGRPPRHARADGARDRRRRKRRHARDAARHPGRSGADVVDQRLLHGLANGPARHARLRHVRFLPRPLIPPDSCRREDGHRAVELEQTDTRVVHRLRTLRPSANRRHRAP